MRFFKVKLTALLCLSILSLFETKVAFAVDNFNATDLIIEAETLENILDKQLKATGDALLVKSGKKITADSIIFDQISNELEANGNVELRTGTSLISGEKLFLNVDNATGNIMCNTFK